MSGKESVPAGPEFHKRILLVEDNRADAVLVRRLLERSPSTRFQVDHVERLDEALHTLRRAGYDLVLLDLSLPDARGLETVTRTRPVCKDVPLVVMSGLDDETLAVEAVKAGAQDYLVKGQVDERALTRTILYAVERQRMILALERAREREHFLATHDSLTGLPNRPQFYSHLDDALAYAQRKGEHLAVLFLDLDLFKEVNDSLGHAMGDELLRAVADRLRSCVRGSDTVARLGGDEFVLLLRDLSHPDDAGRVAETIIRRLGAPIWLEGREIRVTSSVGVSLFPRDGTTPELLVRNADHAMLDAKRRGRNSYQLFAAEIDQRHLRRGAIEKQLFQALRRRQFRMHYQPQIDTRTGRIIGAEALIRWAHPELGLILPGEFIPLAEDTGAIEPIGEWAIREACEQHRGWRRDGVKDLRLAVNLSVSQLRQRDLGRNIETTLRETEMDPAQLDLEITETGLMRDTERNLHTLGHLKRLGARISIDDFGTGHSSLSYLQRFPVDVLKIDRSFIGASTTDRSVAAITTAIIAMAGRLGLETIAEGVETREQRSFLTENACHKMQGFLFSRPVSPQRFVGLWRRGAVEP